jgi:hypothetical protein
MFGPKIDVTKSSLPPHGILSTMAGTRSFPYVLQTTGDIQKPDCGYGITFDASNPKWACDRALAFRDATPEAHKLSFLDHHGYSTHMLAKLTPWAVRPDLQTTTIIIVTREGALPTSRSKPAAIFTRGGRLLPQDERGSGSKTKAVLFQSLFPS